MKGDRTRFLVPLFSAALSALLVAGVYEIRGRAGKPAPPQTEGTAAGSDGESGRGTRGGSTATTLSATCGDLRRRYLLHCPADLAGGAAERLVAPPAPNAPAPDPRAAAELSAWLNPSSKELAEMARHCEVRFDMPAITENEPPLVTDEQAAALSLSDREREVLQRTLRELHDDLRAWARRALSDAGGPSGNASASTMEDMLNELQSRPGGGFEEARERLAQERAAAGPSAPPSAQQPPGERLLRTWAVLGDQFERQLAADLGGDRARQLRTSPLAGWMNRFSQAGCRGEPAPPSR